jgi:thiamine-phosphate pyrophosphorylase
MLDLRLYLVTDQPLSLGRGLPWIVREAVAGGVTMVQIREKDISTREFIELASQLQQILIPGKIPLIINDRVDVVLAVNADGVHIGQSDMPYELARRILGKDKIIGLSVENMEQVHEANRLDVDYIGISPVFATTTKTNTCEPFGLDGIRRVMAVTRHPAVGIGGINCENANSVMQAGANGIAVVSSICSATDPRKAAMELRTQLLITKRMTN